MPTKKRREREDQKRATQALMDNPPEHIRQRMSRSSALAENLKTELYNGGIYETDSRGQTIRIGQDNELGANADRHTYKEDKAAELRTKYSNVWGERGVAEGIADEEGLHVTTIRRYIRDYP